MFSAGMVLAIVSSDATVTSGVYTVSPGSTPAETITNVLFGTPKATFLGNLVMNGPGQDWNVSGINDPVLDTDHLIVTAEDTTTVIDYAITVNSDISPIINNTPAILIATEDTLYSYDFDVTDPDGPTAIWSIDSADTCGGSVDPSTGAYTFNPAGPVPLASCVISVIVSDGTLSDTETATISITAVDDSPLAADDNYTVNENSTLDTPILSGVLTNDSDPEGASITAVWASDPTNGALTLNSDGSFTYIPNLNYIGTDSFTYKVNDGSLDSTTATVNITVRDNIPPVIDSHSDVFAVNDLGVDGAIVTYTSPAVTDNLDAPSTATCLPASGSLFAIASTTVTCTATDAAGNVATPVTFKVGVYDNESPIITLIGTLIQTIERGLTYSSQELGSTVADNHDVGLIASVDSSGVDTSVVGGPFTVTYTAVDNSGNVATPVTRTVNITDTINPTLTTVSITSSGDNTLYAKTGDTVTLNFTADEVLSGLPTVTIAGQAVTPVDNGGNSYTATYVTDGSEAEITIPFTIDFADAVGNLGVQVTSTTDGSSVLFDKTLPTKGTISINGGDVYTSSANVTLDIGLGIDSGSGLGTMEIANSSSYGSPESPTTSKSWTLTGSDGTKTVRVRFYDNAGNMSPAPGISTSIIMDRTAPSVSTPTITPSYLGASTYITNTTDISATVTDGGSNIDSSTCEYTLDNGSSWNSATYDGVNKCSASSVNTTGAIGIGFRVKDNAGNQGTGSITTVQVDTVGPVITLNGVDPQIVEVGSAYVESDATVVDNYDTGLTATIDSSAVNINTLGSYSVTYNAVDHLGNTATQVIRTVNVVDTTKPVITLNGASSINVEVGSVYSELGAVVTDNYDTGLVATIDSSAVNTAVVGTYNVTYNVSDSSTNAADQIVRTVNVVDTTKPVITLVGGNEVTLDYETTYTDAGATALDNYDGNLTASTTINNPVNTSLAGTYYVTYNVTDSAGNKADEVSRKVVVKPAPSHTQGYASVYSPFGKVLGVKTSKAEQARMRRIQRQINEIRQKILLLQHPELAQGGEDENVGEGNGDNTTVGQGEGVTVEANLEKVSDTASTTPKKKPWWRLFW